MQFGVVTVTRVETFFGPNGEEQSRTVTSQRYVALSDGANGFETFDSFENFFLDPETGEYMRDCFPAGVIITMLDGQTKPIDEIRLGDAVLAFDVEGNGVAGVVDKLFTNVAPEFICLSFDDGRPDLVVTPGHRVLSETMEYVAIGALLQLGGGQVRLVDVDGSIVSAAGRSVQYGAQTAHLFERAASKSIMCNGNGALMEEAAEGWKIYNFEVRTHHNYVAAGVRVHNDSIFDFLQSHEIPMVRDFRDTDGDGFADFAVLRTPDGTTEIEKTWTGTTATSEITTSDGKGNIIYTRVVRDLDGNVISQSEPQYLSGQFIGQAIGMSLTPFLAQVILDEDASLFEQIATNTILNTVLGNLGEVIGATINRGMIDYGEFALGENLETIAGGVFEDFGGELIINGANAVTSKINQLVMAEIFEFIDTDGVPGAVLEAVIGAGVTNVVSFGVDWLVDTEAFGALFGSNTDLLDQVREGVEVSRLPDGFAAHSGWASLVMGAVVREILPDLETIEGQVASAIASATLLATGALQALGAFAGPVGAVISWAIGALVDLWFDEDPQAWTNVGFNETTGRFQLLDTWSDDGGDTELSKALAQAYVESMNGFVDTMMAQSHNYGELAQWSFGHYEESMKSAGRSGQTFSDFQNTYLDAYIRDLARVRLDDGKMTSVRALEQMRLDLLVTQGTSISLGETRIYSEILEEDGVTTQIVEGEVEGAVRTITVDGGEAQAYDGKNPLEIYRMIATTLQIADDYHTYLENAAAINALIDANPHSTFAAGWFATIAQAKAMGLTDAYSVNGGAIDNIILTGESDDSVSGGGGDDLIKTYHGDDSIDGGSGENTIHAGAGNDSIAAGAETDWIDAGTGNNLVSAGDGANTVQSGYGHDTIQSGSDADVIEAGDGNNDIDAGHGHNTIVSGSGDDTILAGDGQDYIRAGEGDNLVQSTGGFDRVTAGSGNDTVSIAYWGDVRIDGGDNIVTLGDGDNTVFTGAGHDRITVGNGDNRLGGGDGNNTILSGTGPDTISTGAGIDLIESGLGDDSIITGGAEDTITASGGNDSIDGGAGADTLDGGDGGDWAVFLSAASGVEVDLLNRVGIAGDAAGDLYISIENLRGSNHADTLTGDDASNSLEGQGGDDMIHGLWGDDTLHGGDGNDSLLGDGGADRYDGGTGFDTVSYETSTASVIASLDSGITQIWEYYAGTYGYVETLTNIEALTGSDFADRLTGDDGANRLKGGLRNDTLAGGRGSDTYVYSAGDGSDYIIETAWSQDTSTDLLIFTDILVSDVTFVSDGHENLVIQLSDGKSVTIQDQFSESGTRSVEEIRFADGLVLNLEDIRAKSIEDQKATGTVIGSDFADHYTHALGDGSYEISDYDNDGRTDRLSFVDRLPSEVSFARGSNNALVIFVGDTESVTIAGFFEATGNRLIEEIAFADGTVLDPLAVTARADTDPARIRTGTDAAETISSGPGADSLSGGDGSDIYVFTRGDGQDVIEDNGFRDVDAIELRGYTPDEVRLAPHISQGSDLILTFAGTSDRIRINNTLTDTFYDRIEEIRFDDGTVWDFAGISTALIASQSSDGHDVISATEQSDTLQGGLGDDTLFGGEASDTYIFARGDGEDQIDDNGFNDTDVLRITGYTPDEVFLRPETPQSSHLVLSFAGTDDSIRILNTLTDEFYDRIEEVHFDDGTNWDFPAIAAEMVRDQATDLHDVISASSEVDTLYGGAGNDTLFGGEASDVYRFSRGDGSDVIDDNGFNDVDAVEISGYTPEDVILLPETPQSSHLVLTFAGTNDSIRIVDTLTDTFYDRIEELRFDDGTVWDFTRIVEEMIADQADDGDNIVSASSEADTLYGLSGNDTLHGGEGSDVYSFTRGDGSDVIDDNGFNDVDVLLIRGYVPSEVTLRPETPQSAHLLLTFVGTSDSVLIRNTLKDRHYDRIEEVHFEDGTIWNFAQIVEEMIADQSDDGDNVISGSDEADTLYGGMGNDTLYGLDGSDTYLFAIGDGRDIIDDNGFNDTDTLILSGFAPEDVILRPDALDSPDLRITFLTSSDSILIRNTITDRYYDRIEEIRFDDGTIWNSTVINQRLLTGSALDDLIKGYNENDSITGLGGNDTLLGVNGHDTLEGGDGDDDIDGGYGNDLISAGSGNDVIRASRDRDTIDGGTGSDLFGFAQMEGDWTIDLATGSYAVGSLSAPLLGIEHLSAGAGSDGLTGSADANQISAGGGRDTVLGLDGHDTLIGGAGDDSIDGGAGDDSVTFAAGDGQDTVSDSGTGGNDLLRVIGLDAATASLDLVAGDENAVFITFDGVEDALVLTDVLGSDPNRGVDLVEFDDGTVWDRAWIADYVSENLAVVSHDEIFGTTGADTLSGGLGNDTINGNRGADTYLYAEGDGDDIIIDLSYSSGELDEIIFSDLNPGDVFFSQTGGRDLVITVLSGGSVTITDHFENSYEDMERVVFADGTALDLAGINARYFSDMMTDGADSILGSSIGDMIEGGLGDDTLNGDKGADTYVYSAGDGHDRITDFSYSSGEQDRILLTDLNATDVILSQNAGRDLVITAGSGSITVIDHFETAQEDMERLEFADGTLLELLGINARYFADAATAGSDNIMGSYLGDTIAGGLGDDMLNGEKGSDSYVYAAGDGHDVIHDFSYSSGEIDEIRFTDLNSNDVTFAQNPGRDLVITTGSGSITVIDHFETSQEDMERIVFVDGTILNVDGITEKFVQDLATDGNDSILTGYRADTLQGGLGNDTLNGDKGADTYLYAFGDGDDLIFDFSYSRSELDRLVFTDIMSFEVQAARNAGDDLVLTVNAGGSVTVFDHFANAQKDMERIEFADGVVWTPTDILDLI